MITLVAFESVFKENEKNITFLKITLDFPTKT